MSALPTVPEVAVVNIYDNGYIYEVLNDVNTDAYVGSSCLEEQVRFGNHTSRANSGATSKFYRMMREIGVEHFRLEVIEPWPCTTPQALRMREEYWRKQRNATYNSYRCHVSVEEYKEEKSIYSKGRYIEKQVILLSYQNIYNKNNRDKLKLDEAKGIPNPHHCKTCKSYFTLASDLKRHYTSKKHEKALALVVPVVIV